jgi:cell envelope opacity-associated protein A
VTKHKKKTGEIRHYFGASLQRQHAKEQNSYTSLYKPDQQAASILAPRLIRVRTDRLWSTLKSEIAPKVMTIYKFTKKIAEKISNHN